MGLAEVIKKAAQTSLKVIGNAAVEATYHSLGTFTVTPATGDTVEIDGFDQEDVKMAFVKYKDSEIDNSSIIRTDRKILIAAEDLTATPKKNDYIDNDDIIWVIKDVEKDIVGALWILQGRVSKTY